MKYLDQIRISFPNLTEKELLNLENILKSEMENFIEIKKLEKSVLDNNLKSLLVKLPIDIIEIMDVKMSISKCEDDIINVNQLKLELF